MHAPRLRAALRHPPTGGLRWPLLRALELVDALRAAHPGLDIESMDSRSPLDDVRDGLADIAAVSFAGWGGGMPTGLAIGAVPPRLSPRDVLVAGGPVDWDPPRTGLRIGVASARRYALLRHWKPEALALPCAEPPAGLLAALAAGRYDAVIVEQAEWDATGTRPPWYRELDPEVMVPAVGQGALAMVQREGDARTAALLEPLHDAGSEACVRAERAFVQELGLAGDPPAGAWARMARGRLALWGCLASSDGSQRMNGRGTGDPHDPETVGRHAARDILARGGGSFR